ncbi:MAG: hypothetical protein AB8B50_20830 [Pirellulaceae bacterium]
MNELRLKQVGRRLRVEMLETRRVLDGAGWSVFPEGEGASVPDFTLEDVNATSASYEQSVSPRDYLEQVSAWYFGHSS